MVMESLPISRVYADVTSKEPREYWDYDSFTPIYHSQEPYELVRRQGRGKYSEVFQGIDTKKNRQIVMKIQKPVKKRKIRREIKIMQILSGGPNIISLLDIVKDPSSKTVSLISEYVDAADFKTLYATFTDLEARYYCYQQQIGQDYAHSRGIMHRDIKPHNITIDPENNKLRIIDWGLAEFYHPNIDYNVRVASRHFKAPELLVNMRYYDYSLDMWAFGCVLAGIIFRIHPFFHGRDNIDQLIKICKVLGTDKLREYIQKYNITLDSNLAATIGKHPPKPFIKYVTSSNADLANPLALDILAKVLVFDHQKRLSAQEALLHPYFDPVRHASPTRYNLLSDTCERADHEY